VVAKKFAGKISHKQGNTVVEHNNPEYRKNMIR
jgi:hypothetical protein